MRIIVTGSRDWDNSPALWEIGVDALDRSIREHAGEGPHVIVQGGARGADQIAQHLACRHEWTHETFPADWKRFGRGAGPKRNQAMADSGADLCIALPMDSSKGTWDMVRRAQAAEIPTVVVDW